MTDHYHKYLKYKKRYERVGGAFLYQYSHYELEIKELFKAEVDDVLKQMFTSNDTTQLSLAEQAFLPFQNLAECLNRRWSALRDHRNSLQAVGQESDGNPITDRNILNYLAECFPQSAPYINISARIKDPVYAITLVGILKMLSDIQTHINNRFAAAGWTITF